MGIKVGITGVSGFGDCFAEYFVAHPYVDEVVLADLRPEALAATAKKYGVKRTVASHAELCASDVDAIAIFTQRWTHAPLAMEAMRAGKHVYSSVPAAITLEELGELVETVEQTGRLYMLGETGYYRPQVIFCRGRFAEGRFGRYVYGEGHYYHDMSRFYEPYSKANPDTWRKLASYPPMLYPTHSVSAVLGVTFSRMTHVACFGQIDEHPDGIFDAELSRWGNVFSNETALFRTADGGTARINEFRRIAAGESRMSILGTLGAYEEQPSRYDFREVLDSLRRGEDTGRGFNTGVWTYFDKTGEAGSGESFDYEHAADHLPHKWEDVDWIHNICGVEITESNRGDLPAEYVGKRHRNVSPIHPTRRLPAEFVGLPNTHAGSHQFLVHDFLEGIRTCALPPNHIWQAARYNAPGIVAHASAQRDGERMTIPDFGRPPGDAKLMDPRSALRD